MVTLPLELSEVSLVDKLNTKSTIWKYFRFVSDNNGKPINTNKLQCQNMLRNCFHEDKQHNKLALSFLVEASAIASRADENQ